MVKTYSFVLVFNNCVLVKQQIKINLKVELIYIASIFVKQAIKKFKNSIKVIYILKRYKYILTKYFGQRNSNMTISKYLIFYSYLIGICILYKVS